MVSYLPGIETIVGGNLGTALGDPTGTLAGLFGLLFFVALWAYAGAGFETGAMVFTILILYLGFLGLLPLWLIYVLLAAIALGIMILFGVFHQH